MTPEETKDYFPDTFRGELSTTEVDVRIQNSGHDTDSACDADYHQHCACPKTCRCECHAEKNSLPNLVESEQVSLDSLPHTPTPWLVETEEWARDNKSRLLITAHPELAAQLRYVVCSDEMDGRREQAKADYEFIVRACNSHDDLLKACQMLIAAVDDSNTISDTLRAVDLAAREARKAIAKATGKD